MKEEFPNQTLKLTEIKSWFHDIGCTALFVKELAWNHDSKRQIYLSTDLTPFSQFPNRLEASPPLPPNLEATKKSKPKGSDRIYGHLNFSWISPNLETDQAAEAKLIFYPQYPETRFSGFLKGSNTVPSKFLCAKSGEKYENRLLFLGTDHIQNTYGFLAVGHSNIREDIRLEPEYDEKAGLNKIEIDQSSTSEQKLLTVLRKIHRNGWHDGIRLKHGEIVPCSAPQAVGFTLEALLNIPPNSDNAPDFEGYEVKALTVNKAGWGTSKAVTLMTPEPDIGRYCQSIKEFLEAYGYPDRKGKPNRQNFGGVYRQGVRHPLTGLLLDIVGYSDEVPNRMDGDGMVAFVDKELEIAAAWSFAKLIDTWKNKHEKAVYVQVLKRKNPNTQFRYLNEVQICEGADFFKVMKCISEGTLYVDPAVKAENWLLPGMKIKKRNQFRIAMRSISDLYRTSKRIQLT